MNVNTSSNRVSGQAGTITDADRVSIEEREEGAETFARVKEGTESEF